MEHNKDEMNTKYQIALDAYTEVMEEEKELIHNPRQTTFTFEDLIDWYAPIPYESLIFGRAEDKIPVFLDVGDHQPQSMITVGKKKSGKTNFLKIMAESIVYSFGSRTFSVITNRKDEWSAYKGHYNYLFDFGEKGGEDLVLSLASHAHGKRGFSKTFDFLLIDELEGVENFELENILNLRWLMMNGAERGTWVISTASTSIIGKTILNFIPTKIAIVDGVFHIKEDNKICRFEVPMATG